MPGLRIAEVDAAQALEQVRAERTRRSFSYFAARAWEEVDPAPLVWGWHMQAICDHLQAVTEGKIRRLLINVPPGHAKSMLVSVLWPAWSWLRTPSWRSLFASYADELVLRDARKCRTLIESAWYGGLRATLARMGKLTPWALVDDHNQVGYYANTALGERKALAVKGQGTGFRGDTIVVDDPLKAQDAHSEAARKNVLTWWDETMSSRANDLATGSKVIIMQRLHEADLAGHVLGKSGWDHLCLPSEFEPGGVCKCESCARGATSIGWRDPRKAAGELLFPAKFSRKVLDEARVDLGTFAYAAQHRQSPVPEGGGQLKSAWFRRVWRAPGEPEHAAGQFEAQFEVRTLTADPRAVKWHELIAVMDATFKKTDDADKVAIGIWGRLGPDMYLLDLFWDRAGFVATVEAFQGLCRKWPRVGAKLIEDKANGSAVIDVLRSKIPGIIPVNPQGGKEARIAAASPFVEAGNVWLPLNAEWRTRAVAECASFPNAPNDDFPDMMAYAVMRFAPKLGMAALRVETLKKALGG